LVSDNLQINIFEYTDFRKFLKDYYTEMKERTPYFSYRYFSKLAGFTSPNFLKLVADGKRNLSSEGMQKFVKALKLKAKEARYFRILVLLNQAATPEEKDFYTRQLFKSKVYKMLKPLNKAQYDYYSQWFHIPLRELIGRSDFINDPKWIARQFTPSLSEKDVKDGLETLLKLELIEETDDGSYCKKDHAISTGDEVTSNAVANYHRKMIQMGADSIDKFDPEDREISSLTLGVSKKTSKKIKEMIQDFRKEILGVLEQESEFEDVVQLNFQLFPIIQKKGDEND